MDQYSLLLPLAGFSSLLLLVRAVRSRSWDWIVTAGLVLLTAGVGLLSFPQIAGYTTGGVWLLLVVLPSVGRSLVARLSNQQRYAAAARVASILRLLHPTAALWEHPRLLRAHALAKAGATAQAEIEFEALAASSRLYGRDARVHLLRMRSRWSEVLEWLREGVPDAEVLTNLSLLLPYLRALGEVGAVDELVLRYGAAEPRLGRAGARHVALLFVFAFTGRASRVASLFRGPLATYPRGLQTFWLATADLASGAPAPDRPPPRIALAELMESADAALRISARRRLDDPLADPATSLGSEASATLDRLEKERDQEERYGDTPGAVTARAYVTFALMVPILAMFALELLAGGSEDTDTLLALGALWPESVLAGEWWRLGTATLLHFGWAHLLMNLAGLYVLGPFVERALGRLRYVIVYEVAGLGMMGIVVLLTRLGWMEPQVLVGASGAIMGLIGATAAVLVRGGRVEGALVAKQRLRSVALIVVVQAIFDRLTPNVSFMSHLGGALIGFAVAALMKHAVTRPATRA